MRKSQIINRRLLRSKAKNNIRRSGLLCLLFVFAIAAVLFTRAQQAAPPRLHVYVHYDYLVFSGPDAHSDEPDPKAIQLVVDAYATHGIDLVIDPKHTAIPARQDSVLVFDFGPIHMCTNGLPDVYSLQSQYFHPTSNHEWHYAVFGDYIGSDSDPCQPGPSGGIAEFNGDNFIVALSPFLRRVGLPPSGVGGIFMHELGHNLGLHHGGDVDQNFKPNYLSVMNYRFQGGIPYATSFGSTSIAGRRLDYSNAALSTLDEVHLNETVGIQAGSTDITFFDTPNGFGVGAASGPIDWNLNGSATDTDVAVDLDWYQSCICFDVRYEQMTGFDDWAEIRGYLDGTLVHGPKTIVDENHANEPMITSIAPNNGPATGGTTVTITGSHFNKVTQVVFGVAGHANFTIVNDKTIVAVAPPANLAGYTADVTVLSGANSSPSIETDEFTYTTVLPVITGLSPTSGPGGVVITVTGFNFTGTHDLGFYAYPFAYAPLGFMVLDDRTILLDSPGYLLGAYHVLVYNAFGSNFASIGPADTFLFTPPPPPPTVTSVSPTSGPAAGGTTITISGTGFLIATSVSVGPYGVASYTILNDTTITAVTNPAGALGSGTFDVTVTNASGTSAQVASDQFTYF